MARSEIPFVVTRTSTGLPASGASVLINIRGGGAATVYAAETGGTTLANPLTTTAEGRVDGWLDEGSYDMTVSGAGITTYNQPVESVKGQTLVAFDGARLTALSVPGTALAALGVTGAKIALQTITKDKLDPNVLPIGTVIDWWRPSSGHALPTGWLVADGASVIAANHDFTGGGTIVLPDLRNAFIIGADNPAATSYRGDNTAGTAGDATSAAGTVHPNAPGVRFVGGLNVQNFAHTHTLAHTHTIAGHSHTMPDHTHTFGTPDHLHNLGTKGPYSGANGYGSGSFYMIAGSPYGDPAHTGASDRSLAGTTSGASNGNTTTGQSGGTITDAASTANTGSALSSTQDNRPRYVGLIKLIKVKAT